MTTHNTRTRRKIVELHHYYRNPRIGDVPKIKASLQELGQFKEIVVNLGTLTGRPDEVLAGNHTMKAAEELGWDELDVREVDVDETTAAKIVAADNKTGDSGTYDDRLLAELLADLPDLAGTGFDAKELDDLMRETAIGADAVLASFSHGVEQANQQQREQSPPPAAAPPTGFETGGYTGTAPDAEPGVVHQAPAAEPAQQQQPQQQIQPPTDDRPYFTVAWTLTGEERDVVLAALRHVQTANPEMKSPQAIVEICRRVLQ